jgi:hypothetical protein
MALRAAVRPLFDLGQDWTGSGTSNREHFESSERATGRPHKGLQLKPIPAAFERSLYLWQELHRGRSLGGLGLGPLSWQDIHAFCQITNERLSADQLEAIRVIDAEFFASQAAAEDRRGRVRAPKP